MHIDEHPSDKFLELVDYYLTHRAQRDRIAEQGHLAVAQHTDQHRAEYMVATMQQLGVLKAGAR